MILCFVLNWRWCKNTTKKVARDKSKAWAYFNTYISLWEYFGTGTFWICRCSSIVDISTRRIFGTGAFRCQNVLLSRNIYSAEIILRQNVPVLKYPHVEISLYQNVLMPKSSCVKKSDAWKSPCQNVPVMKCPCQNISFKNFWCRNQPKNIDLELQLALKDRKKDVNNLWPARGLPAVGQCWVGWLRLCTVLSKV